MAWQYYNLLEKEKWIPIEEANDNTRYEGFVTANCPEYKHKSPILYEGQGIGYMFGDKNNPDFKIENIISLRYKYTTQERIDKYKNSFDINNPYTQLNIYGLFHDCYDLMGCPHDPDRGILEFNFYMLDYKLNILGKTIVGICFDLPPKVQKKEVPYCGIIFENIDGTHREWIHISVENALQLREDIREEYEKLLAAAR